MRVAGSWVFRRGSFGHGSVGAHHLLAVAGSLPLGTRLAVGDCEVLPPVLGATCEGISGVVGSGVDAIIGSGATAILREVVGFVVNGAAWLLVQVASLVDTSTSPDVTARWFRPAYADMTLIAAVTLLPFLILAIIQHIIRQDLAGLLRSAFAYLPLALIGTGGAVVVVDLLVGLTDALSGWVGQSIGADLEEFATGLGTAVLALTAPAGPGVAGFAALLAGAAVAFAAFVIWLELLLRQAAIYIAVLFLPLAFSAMVWPATAHWIRRLVQGLVAIILSKFVIVAVIALAASALDAQVATEGYGVVIAGASMLGLAAMAPYVLLRLIPVFESGMASQLEGTYRRPTAAVATPAGRSQVLQMARQRVEGSWLAPRSHRVAAGPSGAAATGSSVGAGAGSAAAAGGAAVVVGGAKAAGGGARAAGRTAANAARALMPWTSSAAPDARPPEPTATVMPPADDPAGKGG